MRTRAIHLITTTYGTWLPGDDRGHWSALFDMYGHLVRAGHRLNLPDETTRRIAAARMSELPKHLDVVEQLCIGGVIRGFTRLGDAWQMAGWSDPLRVLALAIENDHMHLLISATSTPLGKVIGRMKSNASSALLKLPGNLDRSRIWTAGHWKVW